MGRAPGRQFAGVALLAQSDLAVAAQGAAARYRAAVAASVGAAVRIVTVGFGTGITLLAFLVREDILVLDDTIAADRFAVVGVAGPEALGVAVVRRLAAEAVGDGIGITVVAGFTEADSAVTALR